MNNNVFIGNELPEITQLKARLAAVEAERDSARAEAADLQALFDLQRKRMVVADGLWRKAHPEEGMTLPDLGRLLEWLMEQVLAAQAGEARAVEACSEMEYALHGTDFGDHGLDSPIWNALEGIRDISGNTTALDWLAQREAAAKAEHRAENAALRKIVVDLHWMARRYADGRMSTAPEMFNDAVKALLAMGIKFNKTFDQIIWARDSMGRRYDGLTNAQATPGTPEALGDAAALRAGKGVDNA